MLCIEAAPPAQEVAPDVAPAQPEPVAPAPEPAPDKPAAAAADKPAATKPAPALAPPLPPITADGPYKELVAAYRAGTLKLPKPPPLRREQAGACRSPAEPGCQKCCITSKLDACAGLRGSPEPPGNGSPPWFSSGGLHHRGPCEEDCKPCAKCTLREEWELANARMPPPECDCTERYPGTDHCFSPMSCGCTCGAILGLIDACPHLHPARAQ